MCMDLYWKFFDAMALLTKARLMQGATALTFACSAAIAASIVPADPPASEFPQVVTASMLDVIGLA